MAAVFNPSIRIEGYISGGDSSNARGSGALGELDDDVVSFSPIFEKTAAVARSPFGQPRAASLPALSHAPLEKNLDVDIVDELLLQSPKSLGPASGDDDELH
jgi:hypothetical protein